jgi:hypothetical protein
MKLIEIPLTPTDAMFREPPRAYTPGSTRPVKPNDAPLATNGEVAPTTEPDAPPPGQGDQTT